MGEASSFCKTLQLFSIIPTHSSIAWFVVVHKKTHEIVGFVKAWRRVRDCPRFARTSEGFPHTKNQMQKLRSDTFFISLTFESKLSSLVQRKMPLWGAFDFFWRRVRDSNPRTCYSQQFSRLPQSTALPTLRGKSKV